MSNKQHSLQMTAAFAAVYVFWGSTYLALRIGVHDLPLLFATYRFLIAAPLMIAYAFWRGGRLPVARSDWAMIAATGALMLAGASGLVTWAMQWMESGQAALIAATAALWMAGFGMLGARGERPALSTLLGLLMGFAGVALLIGNGLHGRAAPWYAYLGMLLSQILWAAGSILSRRHPIGCTPAMTVGLQMLVAGGVMLALALLSDEPARWQWTPTVAGSMVYLAIFGSCIGYGAYFWLVHEATPAQLGTYAYVNPAVAVFLGWLVLDEQLGWIKLGGTLVILLAVGIVTLSARPQPAR